MMRADYKPMICPVCNDFYFSEPLESEINEERIQCTQCGWLYSLHQVEDEEWFDPSVKYSLNSFRDLYREKKKTDPSYNYADSTYEPSPHLCPVCGKTSFSDYASFEVCPVCGWEDDPVMEDDPNDWAGSANDLCLNDFRKRYYTVLDADPNYRFDKIGLPK